MRARFLCQADGFAHGPEALACISSLHNSAADASETILTAATDVSVAFLLFLRAFLGRPLDGAFQPSLACDDLKDAYHGMPNKASQLRFTVVATRDPKTP